MLTAADVGEIRVDVLDARGHVVRTLLTQDVREAGHLKLMWDGRDDSGRRAASGTYLVRLQTPGGQALTKVALLK